MVVIFAVNYLVIFFKLILFVGIIFNWGNGVLNVEIIFGL